MKNRICGVALMLVVTSSAALWCHDRVAGQVASATSGKAPQIRNLSSDALTYFEANRGQVDLHYDYISRAPGRAVLLARDALVLPMVNRLSKSPTGDTVKISFAGALLTARAKTQQELQGKVNYIGGSDPTLWKLNVPIYKQVVYEDLYDGIDLRFHNQGSSFEFDWIVKPGAKPSSIRMRVDKRIHLKIDSPGNLELASGQRKLLILRPAVFQQIGSARQEISGRFVLRSRNEVGVEIEQYDREKDLIIDPVVSYASFLGGQSNAIAVDSSGSAYITGVLASTFGTNNNFPLVNPIQGRPPVVRGQNHIFVSKFTPDGSALLYSSILWGNGSEEGLGIAVDNAGSAYLTGWTTSSNFPVVNALQSTKQGTRNAFVAKLSPSGSSLQYSTYLGGNHVDEGHAIAVDSSGEASVTGMTNSTSFPLLNAFQTTCNHCSSISPVSNDGFVAKISAAGSSLVYSTYLGGSSDETGNGIAVDAVGNAVVVGTTGSCDFPTRNAFQSQPGGPCGGAQTEGDAFVTRFSSTGAMAYSTYLGGNSTEEGNAIALDASGDMYVTGMTGSLNFPIARALFSTPRPINPGGTTNEAFVTELNASGSALIFSTYLGGSSGEKGLGVVTDSGANIYVTGWTQSTDFPVVNAIESTMPANSGGGANQSGYTCKLAPSATSIIYCTYLGGSAISGATGIATDNNGASYTTGTGGGSGFPSDPNGSYGAFVIKIQ